jgi:hypothetical protein
MTPGEFMTEKSPPSEKITTIARQWQKNAILNPAVLEQLFEINHIYLDMLALGTRAWIGRQQHLILPDPVTASLMELDAAHRAAAARCPFTLFNAQFHNASFWISLGSAAVVRESTKLFADTENKRSSGTSFTEMALFYAWHLVRSHPHAAQLLLGMKSQTVSVFKQFSLARLRYLSTERPDLITPRWPERTRFWKVMLSAARQGAEERIVELRLVGVQMMAAELAANMPSEARARTVCNTPPSSQ